MKQFLQPSAALKIALNVQSGQAEKLRKKKGKRVEWQERGGREKGGAWVHEVEEKKMRNECRALATWAKRGRHTTFHFREGL